MNTLRFHAFCSNCVCIRTLLLKSKLTAVLTMPKKRDYVPALQETRLKLREKKGKYVSGQAYLQILGSGARGAAKSLFFFTDYCRYMFNCGEGTQRLAHEHKIKISRLEHIFITHPSWENIGGLPGLALTVQEVGVPDLTIHGPSGIDTMFSATNRFIVLNNLNVKMADCSTDSIYDDQAVTIYYVPLMIKEADQQSRSTDDKKEDYNEMVTKANESRDDIDYYAHMKKDTKLRNPMDRLVLNSTRARYTAVVMNYVCKLKPKIGALNLEKCVDKGVTPGPLLGKLKNGEDVVLPDGTLVKSSDVKDPDCPGPVFMIIDCPSIAYINELINNEKFQQHQTGPQENIAQYIFHCTSSDVMKDERYQSWMNKFPETTTHINLNDSNTCLGNVGVHILQRQLNYLDPEIFPLLSDQSIPIVDVALNKKISMKAEDIFERGTKRKTDGPIEFPVHASQLNIPSHVGHTLKFIDLRVSKQREQNPTCVCINPKSIMEDLYFFDSFQTEYEVLKSKLSSIEDQVKSDNEKTPYPIVTFLGTGSSIPNKSRNTSGILVTLNDDCHMIMDCGEGTFGQLVRHFGVDRTDEILASTKAIYISHLHADHHIGCINLLKRRREAVNKLNASDKKVYLLAPKQILFWFYSYHLNFEPILNCLELITNQSLTENNLHAPHLKSLLDTMNLKEVRTINVHHCPHSFGIAIVDSNNHKITYSGDTMPTDNLLRIGMDSDLLIHEATFEDDLSHEAKVKMHSTTSEAISMGKKMNAKFTLLTHFSQRYYKIPVITDNFDDTVGIAFDNLRVRLGDLKKLPLLNPVLKIVFSEEKELLESRMLRRKRKLEF